MNFSIDRYNEFTEKLDKYPKTTQYKYIIVMIGAGLQGLNKTRLKEFLKELLPNLKTVQLTKEITEVLQELLDEEFLFTFEGRGVTYYKVEKVELYLSVLLKSKEYIEDPIFQKAFKNITFEQKTFPTFWGTMSFRPETIIREFVVPMSKLNSTLLITNYFNPEFEETSLEYVSSLWFGLFSLYSFGYLEDNLTKNFNTEIWNLIYSRAYAALLDGVVDVYSIITFDKYTSKLYKDEGILKALLLFSQGFTSSALETIGKADRLDKSFVEMYIILVSKEYDKTLERILSLAGLDNVKTHFKKKSSKFWTPLSTDQELILMLLLYQKYKQQSLTLLRNRYIYFDKKSDIGFPSAFYSILLEAVVLLSTNSTVDNLLPEEELHGHLRYHLQEAIIHGYGPMSMTFTFWIYGKLFGQKVPLDKMIYHYFHSKTIEYQKAGYKWYASLYADALGENTSSEEGVDLSYLIDEDLFRFEDVLSESSEEEWELLLQKMGAIAEDFQLIDKKENKGVKEGRLLWVVSDHRLYVQPMEQTKLKNGKWSKPKKVSDTRLLKKGVKGMLEIDHEILDKAIRTYGRGYMDFDVLEVWKRLEGHPNVVLESDDNVSVIVEKRPFELQIDEAGEHYRLSFDKDINIDFPLKRETPTRVIYYNVDKKIKHWAESFPQEIIIPKKGKKQLKEAITALGQTLNIHSNVEDIREELPEVKADQTIYALLTPRGNNILLELYMKPFKTTPPYVTPASGKPVLVEEVDRVRTRAIRNLEEEKAFLEKFYYQRPFLDNTNDGHHAWELSDREETLNALQELQFGDIKPVVEWPKGVRFKLLSKVGGDNITMNIQSKKRDWFAVSGEVKVNEEVIVSLESLLKAFKNDPNSNYVEIEKDQFIALTDSLRKQLATLTSVAVEDKLDFRVHRLSSYGALNALTNEALVRSDKSWQTLQEQINTASETTYAVPNTLQATLRDYQVEGYQWLSQLASWGGGACLADDMGLGKTLQGIALMVDKAKDGPSLVVAPSSVTFNWVNEIRKFAPTLKPHLLYNTNNREVLLKNAGAFDVIICSYGLLQSTYKPIVKKDWNIVLLDEAQAIKNKTTKRSQVAMQLEGKMRIVTTGTPIENNLSELWNLFQFINPGLLGSWESFNKNFVLRIDSGDQHHAKSAKKVLRKLITPFILRRKKSEVLDELPSKTESVLSVNLSEDEMTLYEAHRRTALEEIEGVLEKNKDQNVQLQVLAELTKLRQLCCHPSLVDHEFQLMGSKITLLLETLHELKEGGHRALIFSQFVGFLSIIRKYLEREGISYQYLDGSTTLKNREKGINAFQSGEGDVFLISLKAGGTGLNLTAADYVIHMDPWWNPAVEDQATDRAHRMGQKRPVTVYRLICKDTLEERMIQLHADKRELADDLLSGTNQATKLNTSELLKLLQKNETILEP
ncbi:DEAD/DEAH box helicase [Flammeovirga aprica]|uniref:DEAD/DEAH box helicase n=1 Tax=Flammeovirga aprica JL-4 TaxID=694437 RepID=A0A7X9S0H7_9BACT|nr:DEAD/DEAH box helicase [Flammeovirga aprica]NME72121.1 DEAD/DEAH box helicase [Flammeovirga aprica JL-4]